MTNPKPEAGRAGASEPNQSRGTKTHILHPEGMGIEGVLSAAGVRVVFLTPAPWKRFAGIPVGREEAKNLARSKAIALWPNRASLFARRSDHNRAEASLIGLAGPIREGRQ